MRFGSTSVPSGVVRLCSSLGTFGSPLYQTTSAGSFMARDVTIGPRLHAARAALTQTSTHVPLYAPMHHAQECCQHGAAQHALSIASEVLQDIRDFAVAPFRTNCHAASIPQFHSSNRCMKPVMRRSRTERPAPHRRQACPLALHPIVASDGTSSEARPIARRWLKWPASAAPKVR
jgi:hypothetical protein